MDGLFHFETAISRHPEVDEWFAKQAPELGALARTWYERIRACGDDVRDVMHDGCPTACAGDAAFAYVGVYSAHVSVGFFRGADLDDPSGLLEGTGKRMRHVKVRPSVPFDADALTALISAAYADMKRRLEPALQRR